MSVRNQIGGDLPRILAISPFEAPCAGLVAAVCRAGGLGVLDLGRDPEAAAEALQALAGTGLVFGVRVPQGVVAPALPEQAVVVVVPEGTDLSAWPDRTVLVQATSVGAAVAAERAGAGGIIAKGAESGGQVSDEGAFVLLQRVVQATSLPVWAQGGIGVHTAAAALVGGARGVVLDAQLALVEECELPDALRTALSAMDGSETTVVGGHRVYYRPDLPVARLAESLPDCLGAGPLDERLVPAGQDAAFARDFARRWPRAGAAVRGLGRAMDGHRGQAVAVAPHAPGSPFARQHGLRYPIFQGPMTRVSDVASFAEAVAGAGAMPFLALSLLHGERLDALLQETRDRLGDLPWGVGMLGFAPPELRAEQLAAVRNARPPVALLAGGRPAQARELEQDGVPTYLHVPSPGLLDLFLKEGARRFVFEGRECGGHVGPRTSFVLWETFVERLLAHEAPQELSVVFAGGIHDARSAAMVSALAAPLAVRGARIGLLMGTAYLFTEEAVSCGAITQAFQEAAVSCKDTVLVHTSPGHATRCVQTPFVDAFHARHRDLQAKGAPPEVVWESLERFNVGRLRLAAKGIRRDGEALVDVDPDTQRRDGLFMIGQVAALRDRPTTLDALHRAVSEGPAEFLQAPEPPPARPQDVAIVGMAGFFPGAPDLEAFWSNIVLGRDAVTEVPAERWNVQTYYDAEARSGDKSISKWGGFLPDIDFDPVDYGIPPRSLAAVEPVQLLALEAARRALQDAGYGHGGFDRDRASVIFGAEAGTDLAAAYGFRALYPQYLGDLPPELDAVLPSLTEDSFPGVLANVIAGRIANRLDLGGVNYTVDAACASALAALDLACKELASGTSDLVLCGGGDLHNTIADYLLFSSVRALSRTGRSRPFDAEADGIALGEGVAVVVCKRLADAERDGDRIYAVVKGVAGSSDGRSLGLTAPRQSGQERALERAYAQAGVSPAQVGLVEAHGTGTVVGDRTELGTLTEVYTRAGTQPGTVTLGSVKSNIGHTKCAAGLAGLVKAALALHHQVLPPTLHVNRPNPAWQPHCSPFGFRRKPAPWPGAARHAAVSAFGFGGTNFHAVLAAHAGAPARGLPEWPAELFLFRDEADLARLVDVIDRGGRFRLRDLAAAIAARGEGPVRVALVAEDVADLRDKLIRATHGRDGRGTFRAADPGGTVAFLFPGQGSQRPGMLADLFVAFPAQQALLGSGWRERLFPPDAWDPAVGRAQRAAVADTRVAQPALGMVDLAAAQVLASLGVEPDAVAGHSYGEVVALCVAGAFDPAALVPLSQARAAAVLAAAGEDPGAMVAADGPLDRVEAAVAGVDSVVAANLNSPMQTVLSGTTAGIEAAEARLEAAGIGARRLQVACGFHSPVVAGARDLFTAALERFDIGAPTASVWCNTTAAPYAPSAEAVRTGLAEQLVRPVRFQDQVEAMHASGVRVFVEVGPGRVLTGLVEQTLGDRPHLALSVDDPRGGGALHGLVRLLAQLAAAGVPVRADALFEGRGVRPIDLDAMPAPSSTAWKVNGQRAWPVHGAPPDNAMKVVLEPLVATVGGTDRREQVVLEYLRTLREQADKQREVMLSFLGDAPLPPAALLPAEPTAEAPLPDPPQDLDPAQVLLDIVSRSTGYPPEMLDLDLDLEADLSIDSIKRIEILGLLGERLGAGLGIDNEELVEELARVKTLRGVLDWIAQQTDNDLEQMATEEAPRPAPPGHPLRFVPELEALEPTLPGRLERLRVGLSGSGGPLAEALVRSAAAEGARARVLGPDEDHANLDVLVTLMAPPNPEQLGAALFELADLCRSALIAGVQHLVVVTRHGGHLGHVSNGALPVAGAGVSGLLKSVAKEWPLARIRRVDLDPGEDAARAAGQVLAELADGGGPIEVGYREGRRLGRRYVPAALNGGGSGFAIGRDAVVLLTGGARGITARVARGLAERSGCTLILVGRSPAPPAREDPATARATTPEGLRATLVELGERETARVEARARRLLAEREMRATFAAIGATGARLEYHAVDVRDGAAVATLVARVYREHGRLDAVLHGAGVNEDKLLRDKQADSFQRVFETKVLGAMHLTAALRDDVGAMVFFSSVAGAFGNRGQADYAAANDVLDHVARALDGRIRGRAVSIAWGPWSGGGMVTPALERQYRRRGIGLIDPNEGVQCLLDELAAGTGSQVVLMQARPTELA